jgi:hypothetical protein
MNWLIRAGNDQGGIMVGSLSDQVQTQQTQQGQGQTTGQSQKYALHGRVSFSGAA